MKQVSSRTVVISALAIIVGSVLLSATFHWHPYNVHEGEATWSIQGNDDALRGCPHRYKEWVTLPNHSAVLIGCWGDAEL
jgi:hypothetical protein